MHITQAGMAVLAVDEPIHGLEQIFVTHKDLVFRAAYRITGNASDAEDVLQTVFLRLARQDRQDRSPDIANLPGYLHRSAINASLDLLRARRDSQSLSLDADPDQALAVSIDTAGRAVELRSWLRQALAQLNPRWAEMFVLRFVEDYSNREIAGLMKTSPAVVAVVLHRTRAQLKKNFKALTRGRR